MNREGETVAAEGVTSDNDTWTLLYRPGCGQHCLRLLVNGGEREEACGFDIPDLTEIGFAGGLKPGEGQYYPHGLVTSRIEVARAESHDEGRTTEVATAALPGATANDGAALRSFVLVRPPTDDVAALDRAGYVVQANPAAGPVDQLWRKATIAVGDRRLRRSVAAVSRFRWTGVRLARACRHDHAVEGMFGRLLPRAA